ncbi:hypothetical protein [Variovorax sp. GT1P44]|uniref:hypothetical protein n=1 Tax=Variovorax sp. GT1P44 TaxID=3443742 RepID=UPI003F44E78B
MQRHNPRSILLVTAIAGLYLMWGCTTSHRAAEASTKTVQFSATGMNAGQIGRAFLRPQSDATVVTIEVSGLSVATTSPLQLYMAVFEGRCGALAPNPEYMLDKVVRVTDVNNPTSLVSGSGPFRLTNTAPATLTQLTSSPHALVVRTSPADMNREVFCGNL